MIILGDIGGTKSQIMAIDGPEFLGIFKYFENKYYSSFSELIDALLNAYPLKSITACYLAVAGSVENKQCEMTNLNWSLCEDAISSQLNGAEVRLINDLEAMALSIPFLPIKDLEFLQGEHLNPQNNLSVLSVGTGLGQATLLGEKTLLDQTRKVVGNGIGIVVIGESGHCDFAPHNLVEVELLKFMLKKNGVNNQEFSVSLENLISGQGLINILEFVKNKPLNKMDVEQAIPNPDLDINAEIIRLAEADPTSVYRQTIDIFCDLIANELGNMALRTLSRGGVVVAGGIAPRLQPFINKGRFIKRFSDKNVFSNLLKSIPIAICTNPKAPLVGLYHYYLGQNHIV